MRDYADTGAIGNLFGLLIVAAATVVVLTAFIWATVGDDPGLSPFERNCDQHGGVIARHSHGKSSDYYCIVGERVIDSE